MKDNVVYLYIYKTKNLINMFLINLLIKTKNYKYVILRLV